MLPLALPSLLSVIDTLAIDLPVSTNRAMFFEGDLQSGIALALSESKSVACFIKGASHHTLLECGHRLTRVR